ncbi:MAG: Rieske 2Fe-2S domain-containing protein [Ilumatobacter sp.]
MSTRTFAQNCWYVAACVDDVTKSEPLASTVAGEALVLYRDTSGSVVAMADKCPHRLAPMSLGRVIGDDLRCMYHGLKFGPDGTCVEIPGQPRVPKAMCIDTYAVIESDRWVWVWIGDQAKADPKLRPAELGHGPRDGAMFEGTLTFEANHLLIHDNLCDFSHVSFVHENSLGSYTGGDDFADQAPTTAYIARGIRFDRWNENVPKMGYLTNTGRMKTVDYWISYQYLLPGILLMETGVYRPGTAAKIGYKRPEGLDAFMSSMNSQAVTPIDENRTKYYYSVTHPVTEPDYQASLKFRFAMAQLGFSEDKVMIEAQQRIIDANPHDPMRGIKHDKALNHFRKLIEKSAQA